MPPSRSSRRRQRVYGFIIEYKRTHDGCAPTIREIMAACGYNSTSAVYYILQRLAQDGVITMSATNSRSICVVGAEWMAPKAPLPIPHAVLDKSFDVSGIS